MRRLDMDVKQRSTAMRRFAGSVGLLVSCAALAAAMPAPASAAAACPNEAMYVGAHQDDQLLFESPDFLHDTAAGCVVAVVMTAGENGAGQDYWSSRDAGLLAAMAQMAGATNAWTTQTVQVAGHAVNRRTLTAAPNVVVDFLRIPDGGWPNGDGTSPYGFQSLKKLWSG